MYLSQQKIHRIDLCIHNTKRNIKYKSKTSYKSTYIKTIFKNASYTEVKCFIFLYSACDWRSSLKRGCQQA